MSTGQETMKLIGPVVAVLALAGAVAAAAVWWSGDRRQEEGAPQPLQAITNSLGMQFMRLPGGSFTMGDGAPGQGPVRTVRVAPFYLAAHEVTQAQWQAVMGHNPSRFRDPRRPVEQVTWEQAQEFLEALNRLEGTNRYRLPSEAEWEYAARAGSQTPYFFGADSAALGSVAWFGASGEVGTRPVGSRLPNPWGLYDIYGNVWEWVQDCWHDGYLGAPPDARVWADGDCNRRMLRGGGWDTPAGRVGSAARGSDEARREAANTGFRVAFSP